MGSLDDHHQEFPPLPQDLKVTIQHTSLVFPSQETEKKSLFLSNIDQVLNFSVETVHFFQPHKDFPPHVVAEKLKNTLAKILVPYDFLAGRLKANTKTGKMEIDCNAAGAVFIVASSEYKLDDIGDLVYPNPGFKQLIIKSSFDGNLLEQDDKPLGIFQVGFGAQLWVLSTRSNGHQLLYVRFKQLVTVGSCAQHQTLSTGSWSVIVGLDLCDVYIKLNSYHCASLISSPP